MTWIDFGYWLSVLNSLLIIWLAYQVGKLKRGLR